MERMWRKVSFGGSRSTKNQSNPTDTVSSAGGFGDPQIVLAVAGSSSATGRRLATSGQMPPLKIMNSGSTIASSVMVAGFDNNEGMAAGGITAAGASTTQFRKSLSQHVLQPRSASAERRRRRRRKSRPRRTGMSCVGGGGDNMSSSGGFYTIKESAEVLTNSHHRYHHRSSRNSHMMMANSAPCGTVMMYPNPNSGREVLSSNPTVGNNNQATTATSANATVPSMAASATTATAPDISLRQRAVAKLRMFNFHLNWDLQMTHCKPCGIEINS
ncbi:hypothetical protein GQX74_008902 [Glossina fuscipes]|nr:hypothetical protein GQX74_008902 [Glossina fuscipes]